MIEASEVEEATDVEMKFLTDPPTYVNILLQDGSNDDQVSYELGSIDSTVPVEDLTIQYICADRLAYETQADLDPMVDGFSSFTDGSIPENLRASGKKTFMDVDYYEGYCPIEFNNYNLKILVKGTVSMFEQAPAASIESYLNDDPEYIFDTTNNKTFLHQPLKEKLTIQNDITIAYQG